MHRTVGRSMAVIGGMLAAILFIVMTGANAANTVVWLGKVKGGGGGTAGIIVAILAALVSLLAIGIAVLSFKNYKILALQKYVGATMALLLVSMLSTVGNSFLPFWITLAIFMVIGGAHLASAEGMKIDLSRGESDTMVFTTADIIMLGACALMAIFTLLGILLGGLKFGSHFWWRHLANTILLLLACLANASIAFLSVQIRGLLKAVRWMSIAIMVLAATSYYGLYGLHGFVVLFSAVAACLAYYIEREGEAFGIDEIAAEADTDTDTGEEQDEAATT